MSSAETGKAFGGGDGSQERNESCKYIIPFFFKTVVYSLYIQINYLVQIEQCSIRNYE